MLRGCLRFKVSVHYFTSKKASMFEKLVTCECEIFFFEVRDCQLDVFLLKVFDNVQSSEPYEVVVNVVNSDDEPPVFTSSNSFNITEEDSSLVDTVVFTVSAVNNDAVSGANAIIYSLSGSGAEETFAIDNTTGKLHRSFPKCLTSMIWTQILN